MTVLGVVLALPVVSLLLSTAALIPVGRAWSASLSNVERSAGDPAARCPARVRDAPHGRRVGPGRRVQPTCRDLFRQPVGQRPPGRRPVTGKLDAETQLHCYGVEQLPRRALLALTEVGEGREGESTSAMNERQPSLPTPRCGRGVNPFDAIRHVDRYGREYWDAREMQPLMGYEQWRRFEGVIRRAIAAAKNTDTYSESAFTQVSQIARAGNLGDQDRGNFHLSRYAAYLVAMNGDPNKPEVAAAQAYFATRTREAELGALEAEEIHWTALARAREMVDYKTFRDMVAGNAPDYSPSSQATRVFFGMVQNDLYRHLTGMDAKEILTAREIATWPGRAEGKLPKAGDRKVAKNYLTAEELKKLNRLVGRLCLRAEDIAEDGLNLSLTQWDGLVRTELMMSRRALAA